MCVACFLHALARYGVVVKPVRRDYMRTMTTVETSIGYDEQPRRLLTTYTIVIGNIVYKELPRCVRIVLLIEFERC